MTRLQVGRSTTFGLIHRSDKTFITLSKRSDRLWRTSGILFSGQLWRFPRG